MQALTPRPLSPEAILDQFTADSTLSWVVVYAGPCVSSKCDRGDAPHHQLYIVPMIGWSHYVGDTNELRPTVMGMAGTVSDYLAVPEDLHFIAVLQDDDETIPKAHAIYHHRFGEGAQLESEPVEEATLPN